MKLKAYAKINLSLDVKGKRKDGYHELDMIMVPIDLYDLVNIELATEDRLHAMWKDLLWIAAIRLLRQLH